MHVDLGGRRAAQAGVMTDNTLICLGGQEDEVGNAGIAPSIPVLQHSHKRKTV